MTFLNLLPGAINYINWANNNKSNNSYDGKSLAGDLRNNKSADSGNTTGFQSNSKSVTIKTSIFIIGSIIVLSALPNSVNGQQRSGFLLSSLRREMSPYKGYSGIRVRPYDSLPLVYVHDQTIAVVEVGAGRELFNCELIEIYKANQGVELLKNLSTTVAQPIKISFEQMMELMDNCILLDTPEIIKTNRGNEVTGKPGRGFSASSSTILSGILPGTKWCGAGDLAETFFDLGKEVNLDKCCRNHDICPSKVRPSTTRYEITNNAIFTKSHCTCDFKFLKCLKSTKSSTADIMGNFYFNILRVPCLNITARKFQNAYRY